MTMNEGMVFYIPAFLCTIFVFFWIVFKVAGINRRGLPLLLAIIACFVLAPFHPYGLVVAVIPFALGYKVGRSTSLRVDPTDTFSPRVKVSALEYDYRAEQFIELMRTQGVYSFLLNERVLWPNKMSLLYTRYEFGLYRRAPIIALLTSWLYLIVWSSTNLEGQLLGPSPMVLLVLSLPYGTAIGELVKYIKGHQRHFSTGIEGQTFRPTVRSFILSFIWDISPIVTATLITYFMYEKAKTMTIILDAVMCLFSLYLITQTIFVHLQKITLRDEGVLISGSTRPYGVLWSDVEKVEVRERHNIISGTDRLVVLYSKHGHEVAYPVSILSKDDQNTVLLEIRKRIPTSTKFDRPTL